MADKYIDDLFAAITAAQELADLAKLEVETPAPAPAAVAPKWNGLSYLGDEGTISRYAVNYHGQTSFFVLVDNAITHEPTEAGVACAPGVTLHRIHIQSVDGSTLKDTNGYAARYEHTDGTGTHIDSRTVAQYVLPRGRRFAKQLTA
jgi:hypothetical protein